MRSFIKSATLGRAVSEIVIIIIGVLIAFQVEDWRAEQESLKQEAAQIAALRADFAENIVRLEELVSLQDDIVAAQTRLLRIIYDHDPRPDNDELVRIITTAQSFHRLKPVMGAYQAMVSSGDLRLLRDQELRAALADFAGTLGDGYEDEELGTQLRVQMFAAMSESIDILSVFSEDYGDFGSFLLRSKEPDFDALFGNQDYTNHIAILTVAESGQTRFYRDLLERARRITEILQRNT